MQRYRWRFERKLAAAAAAPMTKAEARQILGVTSKSSEKDIKLAYYRLAKKHHPDMNPEDRAAARAKFHKINDAYELLKDGGNARAGASAKTGRDSNYDARNRQRQQQRTQRVDPRSGFDEDIAWSEILDDTDVMNEALTDYMHQVENDFEEAYELVKKGDFSGIQAFIIEHPLVSASFVSALVALRYPPLALFILRFPLRILGAIFARGLIFYPQFHTRILGTLITGWNSSAAKAMRRVAFARASDAEELEWRGRRNAALRKYQEALGMLQKLVTRFPGQARAVSEKMRKIESKIDELQRRKRQNHR